MNIYTIPVIIIELYLLWSSAVKECVDIVDLLEGHGDDLQKVILGRVPWRDVRHNDPELHIFRTFRPLYLDLEAVELERSRHRVQLARGPSLRHEHTCLPLCQLLSLPPLQCLSVRTTPFLSAAGLASYAGLCAQRELMREP